MLTRSKHLYQVWHAYLVNLKRVDRVTLGAKIDELFLALLEYLFRACFAGDKFEKLNLVSQAIAKADLLKLFLQIGWEHKVIDHKQYSKLLLDLEEIGRMLGGWKKKLNGKTPPR